MITYSACTVGNTVRFDLYGEVQEADRIAVFLTPDEALRLSRDLATRALALGAKKESDTEDLV
jgi:hypothetical protein